MINPLCSLALDADFAYLRHCMSKAQHQYQSCMCLDCLKHCSVLLSMGEWQWCELQYQCMTS